MHKKRLLGGYHHLFRRPDGAVSRLSSMRAEGYLEWSNVKLESAKLPVLMFEI